MSDKTIALLNGKTINATHIVNLPSPTHVLLQLTTNLLVSIPKLAEVGYMSFSSKKFGSDSSRTQQLRHSMHKKAILQRLQWFMEIKHTQ
jgi:hypothetical protein